MSVHVEPVRAYVAVFLALMVLTALTVLAAAFDLGALVGGFAFVNDLVAMAIAIAKAALVVWVFMHVRHATPLTRLVLVGTVLWLAFLIGFTVGDYGTRGWLGVPGK